MKKSFHIPPSYSFSSTCSDPRPMMSLTSFVSTCSSPLAYLGGLRPYYQQQKSASPSASSLSTSNSLSIVPIHCTDNEIFETPPSTNSSIDDLSITNPFEILAKKNRISNENQVRYFSKFDLNEYR